MLACLTQCGLVSAYGNIMSLHGNDFISLPLCTGNPPVVGGFRTQRSCDAELWYFLWYIGNSRGCVYGIWQYNVLSWMKYYMGDENNMHCKIISLYVKRNLNNRNHSSLCRTSRATVAHNHVPNDEPTYWRQVVNPRRQTLQGLST